jgi:hypothetical protein
VTVAREISRLQRSFAGVESTYVFDLGRRERGESRERPVTAGHQARRAADRLGAASRRVRGERSTDSARHLARR